MRIRYCIAKSQTDAAEKPLSLEACQAYFAAKADFTYNGEYAFRSAETVMTIKGDFFIWHTEERSVPFRLYDGGLYVTVTDETIYHKMQEIAGELEADYAQG